MKFTVRSLRASHLRVCEANWTRALECKPGKCNEAAWHGWKESLTQTGRNGFVASQRYFAASIIARLGSN